MTWLVIATGLANIVMAGLAVIISGRTYITGQLRYSQRLFMVTMILYIAMESHQLTRWRGQGGLDALAWNLIDALWILAVAYAMHLGMSVWISSVDGLVGLSARIDKVLSRHEQQPDH